MQNRLLVDEKPNYHTFEDVTEISTESTPSTWAWISSYIPSYSQLVDYLPFAKKAICATAAFVTTLPSLPYLITDTPEEITLDFLANKPLTEQLYLAAIIMMFAGITGTTCYNFYTQAAEKIYGYVSHVCESACNFVTVNSSIVFALLSAIPQAALGFLGAIALGTDYALAIAACAFAARSAMSIVFNETLINRVRNLFNEDRVFQCAVMRTIEAIERNHPDLVAKLLLEASEGNELNESIVNDFILKLSEENNKTNLLTTRSTYYQIKDTTYTVTNYTLAAWMGASSLAILGQAGYEGVRISCQQFANYSIDNIPYQAKLSIVATTGASSLIGGALTGYDYTKFLQLIISTAAQIKEKPGNFIKAAVILTCCGLIAEKMLNSSRSMLGPDNLFSLDEESLFLLPYLLGNFFAIIGIYGGATCAMAGVVDNASKTDIVPWLKKSTLSHDALEALKQNGLFSAKGEKDSIPLIDYSFRHAV